jgi:hypothetical protein
MLVSAGSWACGSLQLSWQAGGQGVVLSGQVLLHVFAQWVWGFRVSCTYWLSGDVVGHPWLLQLCAQVRLPGDHVAMWIARHAFLGAVICEEALKPDVQADRNQAIGNDERLLSKGPSLHTRRVGVTRGTQLAVGEARCCHGLSYVTQATVHHMGLLLLVH